MREAQLYVAQRLSAAVMAPLVIGHVIVIIVAVQGGLTAEEILGRTRGSLFWTLYYGLFVLAVAVHAAIGLRNIAAEWLGVRGPRADWTLLAVAVLLTGLGLRAVIAVT